MKSRHSLPRRMFLRGLSAGAAISVGVPVLEAMLNSTGDSFAEDGSPIPTRFGFWFWGTGTITNRWVPQEQGQGYAPSDALTPFADLGVLDAVSTATGLRLPGDSSNSNNHHYGYRLARTGSAKMVPDKTYVQDLLPMIWDVAADYIAGDTPFSVVEMTVSRRGFKNSKKSGPEYSPQEQFNLLFGQADLDDPAEVERLRLRGRVVDSVWEQAKTLQKRVGVRDRARLAEHIEALSSIENRLTNLGYGCTVPPNPGNDASYQANQEPLQETNELMADMLVTAMACDLTRVFRYFFTGMQTDTVFWQAGNTNKGHHEMTHDARESAEDTDGVHRAVKFMMSQFAYLLRRMRDTPMGHGTLLDHVSILGTSEMGSSRQHARPNIPILVCGGGGGRLKGGVHVRFNKDDKVNSLRGQLTALRGAGVDVPQFGQLGTEPGALDGLRLAADTTFSEFEV